MSWLDALASQNAAIYVDCVRLQTGGVVKTLSSLMLSSVKSNIRPEQR